MVESVIIIISCYICSAILVHVAYRSLPHERDATHHYILVTKNNERQAEFVLRAITWHAWLFGKVLRISVIDENSEDQTIPIIRRLDRDGQVRLLRTRNWAETERMVRDVTSSDIALANIQANGRSAAAQKQTGQNKHRSNLVKVIYVAQLEDRMTLPLFR